MGLKPYDEYKETDVFWLASIPKHWKWLYLSQVCKEQQIKNYNNAENNVLSLSYGNVIKKKNIDFGLVPKGYTGYQIIDAGNIIMRLTDLQNDHTSLRTGLVKERGIITSAYTCLITKHNTAYIHYLLHSYDTIKVFYGMGGGVRQSIGYNDIRRMRLPVPPLGEQDLIVRYLDSQVYKINKYIRAKKKQIALLKEQKQAIINQAVTKGINLDTKMKPSGIDWIGDIPEGWQTRKIKYLFSIKKEIAGEDGYDILSVTQKGVKIKDISNNEGQIAQDYSKYQLVNVGDFVMNHMDLLTGYVDCSLYSGVTSPDYRVFVLNDVKNNLKNYFLYILQLCYSRKIFYGLGQGVSSFGRWRLPAENFLNFKIPVPTLKEQKDIVDYISLKTAVQDKTIDFIEKKIELMTEYRTRLISDVVTGKVDVRNIEINEVVPEQIDEECETDTECEDDAEDGEIGAE